KWLHTYFNVKFVTLGHDFCYGKNRQGNYVHMKSFGEKQGWNVSQIPPFKSAITNFEPISSTKIRHEVTTGNMENVEALMGHTYTLSGIVAHGDKRGRA